MATAVRRYASPRRRMAELVAAVASAHFILAFNRGLLVPAMVVGLGSMALEVVYTLDAVVPAATFIPAAYALDVLLKGFRRRKALAYGGLGALAAAMLLSHSVSMSCWLFTCLSYSLLLISALVVSVASYSLVVDLFHEEAQRVAAAALCSFSMFVGNFLGLVTAALLVVYTPVESIPRLASAAMLVPVAVLTIVSQELDEPYYRPAAMGLAEYWRSALRGGVPRVLAAVALAYAIMGVAIASGPRVFAGSPPHQVLIYVALASLIFNVAAVVSGLSQALYFKLLASRLGLSTLCSLGVLVYGVPLSLMLLARGPGDVAVLAFISGLGAPAAMTVFITYLASLTGDSPGSSSRLFAAFFAVSSMGYLLSLAAARASQLTGPIAAAASAMVFTLASALLIRGPLREALDRGARA